MHRMRILRFGPCRMMVRGRSWGKVPATSIWTDSGGGDRLRSLSQRQREVSCGDREADGMRFHLQLATAPRACGLRWRRAVSMAPDSPVPQPPSLEDPVTSHLGRSRSRPSRGPAQMKVAEVVPPDDSGSDAFRRYCYQAHVAFLFCLDCAFGGDVISVVAEHIEDIAIERAGRWQFIQVKTKNPDLGPWRLTDLTKDGGALHSALRSRRALGDVSLTIEIYLEGPLKPNDHILLLKTEEGRRSKDLHERVQRGLSIDAAESTELLERLRLVPGLPSRQAIVDRNLRALGNHASHLAVSLIHEIYRRVIDRVYEAMALELLEPAWFQVVCDPDTATPEAQRTFEAKRLVRDDLRPLIAPITAPASPLLKRIVEPDMDVPSVLEQKLLAGGAPPSIIETAKSLRANAATAEYQNASATIWDEADLLEDLRERLRIRVEALVALHQDAAMPAIRVWYELLGLLSTGAETIDRRGVLHRDPDLLLGEVCQLADLCRTDWG